MQWIDDSGATLLAAFISGVIGSVIGPFILRRLRRNDAALEARREWAKEKLVLVFGEGPQMSTDDVNYMVGGLLSVNPWAPTIGDMHAINPCLAESLDLKLIQPRRSALLHRWLEAWYWELSAERSGLQPLKDQWYGPGQEGDAEKRRVQYEKRFIRIEVALTRWSLGVRPTALFWLSAHFRQPAIRRRRERSYQVQ